MAQSPPQTIPNGSRLKRELSALLDIGADISHQQFASRLSGWITFAHADQLSATHYRLKKNKTIQSQQKQFRCKELLLAIHKVMVNRILASFDPENPKPEIKLPTGDQTELSEVFSAYRRFYSAHQREMERQVNTLHTTIRQELLEENAHLAKLASLDKAMADIIAPQARKQFAAIPLHLKKRFDSLVGGDSEPHSQTDWLPRFQQEICTLLLAELETRLMPTLGLVEAIEEEDPTN